MIRSRLFIPLLLLLSIGPSRVDGQVVVVPDVLPGPGDTASYTTLLRLLDTSKSLDRMNALGRMRLAYPDSARAWAIRHLPSLGGFDATVAATTIIGDSGTGIATLIGLLPSLPDSVLQGLESSLGIGLRSSKLPWDSIGVALFGSKRAGVRAFAMALVEGEVDDSPVSLPLRIYLDRGSRDPDPKVRMAALSAIAWRIPASDSGSMAWGVPYFSSGLHDRDADVRSEALHDIGWRGLKVPGQVERIRTLARSGERRWERRAAVRALGVQGMASLPAVPDLIEYMLRGRTELGTDALMAISDLARSGVPLSSTVRTAVRAFRTQLENPYMQLDVVRALGTLRDTSALVELTRDGDTIVAVGAVRALMSVAPTHTALIDALDDPRSDVVDAAIMGVVPILARDSVIATPRTAGGLAALDSARVLAHAIIASRLVGKCFSVQWGTFEPSMRFGADSVFSIPPRTIAFLADPSSFPFGRGYAATIAPANGAAYSVHGPGLWSWDEGADSLRAAWTTGFSGVALNAGWSGAELRGTLSTFWDFPRPQQRAAVTLSPVACTSVRTAMDR